MQIASAVTGTGALRHSSSPDPGESDANSRSYPAAVAAAASGMRQVDAQNCSVGVKAQDQLADARAIPGGAVSAAVEEAPKTARPMARLLKSVQSASTPLFGSALHITRSMGSLPPVMGLCASVFALRIAGDAGIAALGIQVVEIDLAAAMRNTAEGHHARTLFFLEQGQQ